MTPRFFSASRSCHCASMAPASSGSRSASANTQGTDTESGGGFVARRRSEGHRGSRKPDPTPASPHHALADRDAGLSHCCPISERDPRNARSCRRVSGGADSRETLDIGIVADGVSREPRPCGIRAPPGRERLRGQSIRRRRRAMRRPHRVASDQRRGTRGLTILLNLTSDLRNTRCARSHRARWQVGARHLQPKYVRRGGVLHCGLTRLFASSEEVDRIRESALRHR